MERLLHLGTFTSDLQLIEKAKFFSLAISSGFSLSNRSMSLVPAHYFSSRSHPHAPIGRSRPKSNNSGLDRLTSCDAEDFQSA